MFDSIETPRLILDKAVFERNARRFLDRSRALGIPLRPHLKTAKSIDAARVATDGRVSPVTVSTLKEAAYFAAHGYTDILYAVGMAPGKLTHACRLVREGCGLTLVTDDASVVARADAAALAAGCVLPFLIEIDSGEHRGGLAPDDPALLAVAGAIEAAEGLSFRGVMTHAGHSYGVDTPAAVARIAEDERLAVVGAAERLAATGLPCAVVSAGSTPTFLYAERVDGLTEMRCGVYMFFDLAQYSRGVCALDDIALTVLATVIGHNPRGGGAAGALILDAGALALSKDLGAAAFLPEARYGWVCDAVSMQRLGDLAVDVVHQEHGTVPVDDPAWLERLPVGSLVRILPNHACVTAAAHPDYLVVEGGRIAGTWPRVNGW